VPHDQRVKVATIHSFKGWEADEVVVVEPPFGGERAAEAMYVALTRAKSRMVVISSSDPYQLRAQFDPIVSEPDESLVARSADLLAEARLPKARQGPKRGHIPGRPAAHPSRMAGQAPADSEPGPDEPDLWGGWGAPS
jgi:superfamily I DNA/RNA helicase